MVVGVPYPLTSHLTLTGLPFPRPRSGAWLPAGLELERELRGAVAPPHGGVELVVVPRRKGHLSLAQQQRVDRGAQRGISGVGGGGWF